MDGIDKKLILLSMNDFCFVLSGNHRLLFWSFGNCPSGEFLRPKQPPLILKQNHEKTVTQSLFSKQLDHATLTSEWHVIYFKR